MEIQGTFLYSSYVSRHVQSLLKLELFKDKTLVRISVLQYIHGENRPISSAINTRWKQVISKTPKVRPVNINKTNELIVLL